VEHHADQRWILLYVRRRLIAPIQQPGGYSSLDGQLAAVGPVPVHGARHDVYAFAASGLTEVLTDNPTVADLGYVGVEGTDPVPLGLALVSQHVARHHGSVWVEDRPGGGARFVVELPRAGSRSAWRAPSLRRTRTRVTRAGATER